MGCSASRDQDDVDGRLQRCRDVAAELFELDNRLHHGQHYELTPHGSRLFSFVNQDGLLFNKFNNLLDHYNIVRRREKTSTDNNANINYGGINASTNENGISRAALEREFLELVMRTDVMMKCWLCLQADGVFDDDEDVFRDKLHALWFRKRKNRSSSFEHVFVGEIRCRSNNCQTAGLHNWVQYANEERNGNIRYKRYIGKQEPTADSRVVTLSFTWHGKVKYKGSIFVGTTPAFEMALYTYLYYMARPHSRVKLRLGDTDVRVNVLRRDEYLVTAYPQEII